MWRNPLVSGCDVGYPRAHGAHYGQRLGRGVDSKHRFGVSDAPVGQQVPAAGPVYQPVHHGRGQSAGVNHQRFLRRGQPVGEARGEVGENVVGDDSAHPRLISCGMHDQAPAVRKPHQGHIIDTEMIKHSADRLVPLGRHRQSCIERRPLAGPVERHDA
jgi:hypothetical protein